MVKTDSGIMTVAWDITSGGCPLEKDESQGGK
jgi:hypothetical protein